MRRTTTYAAAALIVGANLPDIDALATFGGGDFALWWRRGWSHGVPAMLVLPAVLAALLALLARARGKPVRPGMLLALSYLATWTHPTLDWMNNYGMRWLMPLENRWFYGDTLFIVDPWIWTALCGALFLSGERRLRSVAFFAAFALFAGYLLFAVVDGLWPAKVIWLVAISALAVLRFLGRGRAERASSRLAIGALAAVMLYIGVQNVLSQHARDQVLTAMTRQGIAVEKLMTGPVPVTPFARDVVVQSPDGYRYGRARVWPSFELELNPRTIPKLGSSPVVQRAWRSPSIRGFSNWARFPFAEVEETAHGFTVHFGDARYTRRRGTGLGIGSARVEITKEELLTNGQ